MGDTLSKPIEKQLYADIIVEDVLGETLQCSIPFLLPKGEYQEPDLEKLQQEDTQWLKDWLVKSGLVRRGQSVDKFVEQAKTMATVGYYFAPHLELGSDSLKTYIMFTTLSFLMDDVVEDRNFFGKTTTRALAIPKIGGDIIRGKYKTMADMPTTLPVVMPIIKGLFLACELGRKANPKWSETGVFDIFARTTEESFSGMALLQLEDNHPRDQVSQITPSLYKYLRRFDGGSEAFLWLVFLMYKVELTEEMKQDLLFRRLIDNACSIVTHVNDLLGIWRDLTTETGFNLVAHLSRTKPLSEAFAEVAEMARAEVAECLLLIQRIEQLHKGEEDWAKVVRIIVDYVDGHLFSYAKNKRYGNTKVTFVEKEPVVELGKREAEYLQKFDLVTKGFNVTNYFEGPILNHIKNQE